LGGWIQFGTNMTSPAPGSGQAPHLRLLQVTTRLPGRVDAAQTACASGAELAGAMRRAPAAGGQHENRIGAGDPDWTSWYGAYLAADQAGTELPR